MGQAVRGSKVRLRPDFARIWALESRRAILWVPVLMGLGIGAYFAWPVEPPVWTAALPALPGAALITRFAARAGAAGLIAAWVVFAVTAGFALALWSAHRVAAPMLDQRMAETVEGRVIGLSRSASGAPRVLLDRVVVYGLTAEETPARVRITLLGVEVPPPPGTRLRVYTTLLPPGEPAEPGAFDFRRRAFFEGLGAVGYTHTAPLLIRGTEAVGAGPPPGAYDRARAWLTETRLGISAAVRAALPGASGAFAAAIIVGDRAQIADADAEALRISTLAHLLAISGLHMGILAGLVFTAVRFGVALSPSLAVTLPGKKIAALAALLAGAAYLAMAGATVATQRAYVMVAVALVAVLLDRPAISLRALALAAAILLTIRPVSLLDVGFQMSFAATTALVAGYEAIRDRARLPKQNQRDGWAFRLRRKAALYLGGLVLTSVLAGVATAPFSAFHFNRMGAYGLIANLLAVPPMGLLIAPAAIAAGLFAPFGLAPLALQAMGAGIDWVLGVAHWTAALPGAARMVAAGGATVLPAISLGGLWLFLWRGPWRLMGLAGIAVGLALWAGAGEPRPDLLIASEGRLLGVMGPEGRSLDHPKAQSFVAETWLRRDGDAAAQVEAADREGFVRRGGITTAHLPHNWRLAATHARRPEPTLLNRECRPKTILVAPHGQAVDGPCRYLGKEALTGLGATAVWVEGPDLVRIEGVRGRSSRLWSRRPTTSLE